MAANPISSEIDIINAALTGSGNSPITGFDDGTVEAAVAASNFERVLGAELTHPWTWTQATKRLNRLDGTGTDTSWSFAYQVPPGFEVERLEKAGRAIPWDSMADLILCGEEDGVIAIGRLRPPVTSWPNAFKSALCIRLEALFLRALGEDYDKAAKRDQDADRAFRAARTNDSRRRSPRKPVTSSLLEARRS
jgi:hypothetical protein